MLANLPRLDLICWRPSHMYHCIFLHIFHFFFHIGAANSPHTAVLVAATSHFWPGEGVNNISPLMHVDLCQLLQFTCRRGASTREANMYRGSDQPLHIQLSSAQAPQPTCGSHQCSDKNKIPHWPPTVGCIMTLPMCWSWQVIYKRNAVAFCTVQKAHLKLRGQDGSPGYKTA